MITINPPFRTTAGTRTFELVPLGTLFLALHVRQRSISSSRGACRGLYAPADLAQRAPRHLYEASALSGSAR
jgi:hypothetical protein